MTFRPFWLVHRGHVEARGILFDADVDAPWSVLRQHYAKGARILTLDDQLLLLFVRPRLVDSRAVRGAPLVAYGEHLSAVPLSPKEIASCTLGVAQVIDAVEGQLRLRPFSSASELDPSHLFELSDWDFEPARSPYEIQDPEPTIHSIDADCRQVLDNVIGAPPREASLFDKSTKSATSGAFTSVPFRFAMWLRGVFLGLAWVVDTLRTRVASRARTPRNTAEASPTTDRQKSSPWERLVGWMRARIWQSHLGEMFGALQARYLGQMLERFERGDLTEALRYAIPTSKVAAAASDAGPKLLPARPRTDLDFGGARGGSAALVLSSDLFSRLRATYEQAFSRLVQSGKILEAAFVLSELLEDDARAVAFLESNGRLVQAAKLAESRKLAAGLVVRQWFMAGDRDRAIAIARRDGAFEDAILRLKGIPVAQNALRLVWADVLAASGNFTGAALVLKDVPEGAHLAREWLERAVRVGGVAGAQALGILLRQDPGAFARLRDVALAYVDDDDLDAAAARVALAQELSRGSSDECRAMARGVVRSIIRDSSRSGAMLSRGTLVDLARFSGDGALQADLPVDLEISSRPAERTPSPRQYIWRETDRGASKPTDVRCLHRGRLLVAHGDAGVCLVGHDGRQHWHFDVPCERIVLSSNGDRALAIARRDDTLIVSRIDLATRRAEPWCDLRTGAYASDFDGSIWYVVVKNRVCAIDATSKGFGSLWTSGIPDAPITRVAWSGNKLAFATADGECWRHDLSPHRLLARDRREGLSLIGPNGIAAELTKSEIQNIEMWTLVHPIDGRRIALGATEAIRICEADVDSRWALMATDVPVEVPTAIDVRLVHLEDFRVSANVRIEGANQVCVKLQSSVLSLGDDCGRIMALELPSLRQRLDLRI
ncbi:MAG: bpX6 domain-containing protein [Polyangiaceae bacterium]